MVAVDDKAEDDENDPEKSINAYNTLKRLGYAGIRRTDHFQAVYRCRRRGRV